MSKSITLQAGGAAQNIPVKSQIQSLGFTITPNKRSAFSRVYGMCYGKSYAALLDDIADRVKTYHLGTPETKN